ncbi:MAG: hypothetical protein CM15mP21_5020 [Hyphomicrobiales bacterium]|nr:MAG: hypothetical protein CM15mP21_5020 [Hyphomicrobiales bacterium]
MTQIARLIVGLWGWPLSAYGAGLRNIGGQGFDRVLAEPWGLVTLADVMVGAVYECGHIFSEDDWRVALAWGAPIFILGPVVSCAFGACCGFCGQKRSKQITDLPN